MRKSSGSEMDPIDFDDAYANGKYIDGAETYPPKWAAAAKAFRDRLTRQNRAQLDVPYGPTERERLDLFLPDSPPKGLMVFVHGGYWRAFDKSSWSHLASGSLAHGLAVAMPSYTLAPEARIRDITQQIRAAIDCAAGMVAGPLSLSGHSAGGQLVTRMLCQDLAWTNCFSERIAKIVSISGVHDLRPLLETEMNDDLRLDADEATEESPLLRQDILPVPVVTWVGSEERPVFIQQSQWLARDWANARFVSDPGKHHFNVIDGLGDADSALVAALLPD